MDYHDMLAELGVGSAHPGGMKSTLAWLRKHGISPGARVLDVGCGTGRTACYLKRQFDCEVVGLDIRAKMIQQARTRATRQGVEVEFVTGSAEKLPFKGEVFDLVITESVNVFVQPDRSIKEYHRVLKECGSYIDIEMMTLGPVSSEWLASVKRVYGAHHVPNLKGWKILYSNAGFRGIEVVLSRPVQPQEAWGEENEDFDGEQLSNEAAYTNPQVMKILQENAQWLEQNHRSLAYGIFVCRKEA